MLPFEDHPQRENRRFPIVMLSLLIANVLVFVYMLLLPALQLERFVDTFGAVPARIADPRGAGADLPFSPYLTLITALFIHGGLIHLLGNMIFLWVFGDNVESALGHVTFLGLYVVAGVIASMAHILAFPSSTIPTIGASGAIAGVLAGYLLLFPAAQVRVLLFFGPFIALGRIAALAVIFSWFLIQVFRGIGPLQPELAQDGGIAYLAHIGGFLAGLAYTAGARALRHQPLGDFEARFRWSWTFRNWLIAVILLSGLLALGALVGGPASSAVQGLVLLAAATFALVDGLLRAAGRHAFLGAGRGLGRIAAIVQVLVALAVLGAVLV